MCQTNADKRERGNKGQTPPSPVNEASEMRTSVPSWSGGQHPIITNSLGGGAGDSARGRHGNTGLFRDYRLRPLSNGEISS